MASKQIRPIRAEGNIAYVPLTQGYEAIIDAEDVPLVDQWNWFAAVHRNSNGSIRTVYAVRQKKRDGEWRLIQMHRVIAATPDGLDTDHRDGDGLNNRRKNLRPATTAQNQHNAKISVANTSGMKGVCKSEAIGKWVARISLGGKRRFLGYHDTKEAAAAAYAAASGRFHGEYGRLK